MNKYYVESRSRATRHPTLVAGLILSVAAGAAVLPQKPAAFKATTPPVVATMGERAEMFYIRRFGVDNITVKRVSSGAMLEFRYLVLDPDKAQALTNKKATPLLTDRKTGIKVGVPFVENVGTLRQSPTPVAGTEYWMVFENPSKRIQTGSRVDVAIGSFRASGLVVQ